MPTAQTVMNTVPLVSVVVPAYNRQTLIEETIDSILAQDYSNIELIIIDDGSRDETLARLERYRDQATIISRPNKGENATVNEGLALVTGKYACIVNSDDPILPHCVSTLVKVLEDRPETMVAFGDWASIDVAGSLIAIERLHTYSIYNMLETLNFGVGPGTLIRVSAIHELGSRRAEYRYAGDMEFFLRISLRGCLVHVPMVLATHRVHQDSASVFSSRYAIGREMVDAFERTFANPGFPPDLLRRKHSILARIHVVMRDHYSDNMMQRLASHFAAAKHGGIAWIENGIASVTSKRPPRFLAKLLSIRLARRCAGWAVRRFLDATVIYEKLRAGRWPRTSSCQFCFSTRFLPPMWSGQAVVIRRLLTDVPASHYRFVTHPVLPNRDGEHNFVGGLPGRYYDLPPVRQLPIGWSVERKFAGNAVAGWMFRRAKGVVRAFNLWFGAVQRARQIVGFLKEDCPEILIGCTGDQIDPPATWLAAKILRREICLYYFDDYREQWWADRDTMPIIRFAEHYIATRTDFMIAPTEMMQQKIEHDFGRPCHLVRNPMSTSELPPETPGYPADGSTVKLVFTGAIYHLNYEAFRAIIDALNLAPDIKAELHLYTAQPRAQLESEGLIGPNVVIHPHAGPYEVVRAQCAADILLLPFAFDPSAIELVRTSGTAKLADYLATGRPVVAMVPKNSFLAWFLAAHDCGLSVHSCEPSDIIQVIRSIVSDPSLRQRLSANSRSIATSVFDPVKASEDFQQIVQAHADTVFA